jgi:hypothetical protein
VAEKKLSVRPVPSATVGKAVADGLLAFAESLRLSAKAGFPVVFLDNYSIVGHTFLICKEVYFGFRDAMGSGSVRQYFFARYCSR